jgi:hypothetical protein
MIGVLRKIGWFLGLVIIQGLIISGCSERASEPVILPDSTIIFPSIKEDGISVKITFSRNYGQKSGRQSAITKIFPLKQDENIYAVIDLENRQLNMNYDLMFHIDWIGPDGRSFYLKRTDLLQGDSISALVSSISVEPDKRPPGDYMVRIYLFRELIAEKRFGLKNESELKKISADIIFYKSLDKETAEMKGIDTVFEIKKKGILRAQISLADLQIYKDDELPFRLEWIGPDGESFYSKKVEVSPADTLSSITGSISITPDKRGPGEYFLRVYLFDEIVGEKKFELKPSD